MDDIENTEAVRFISLLDSFGLKQHVCHLRTEVVTFWIL
jgi:hypothetical protein